MWLLTYFHTSLSERPIVTINAISETQLHTLARKLYREHLRIMFLGLVFRPEKKIDQILKLAHNRRRVKAMHKNTEGIFWKQFFQVGCFVVKFSLNSCSCLYSGNSRTVLYLYIVEADNLRQGIFFFNVLQYWWSC